MREELPTGTVTFLFTDVEGSTRLLGDLGADRYAEVLAAHHRVCRRAWSAHGGVEVDTAGDAFFVAFERPSKALAAAALAQELLEPVGVRVRMGVHTGEVKVAETGYVGLEVHRAARLAAAASGGQVLVSASTAALVDVPLQDLGQHRFKDLQAAERVYQMGRGEFPPLRSLRRSNLPIPSTPFLGRAAEVADVADRLGGGGARVVTLTGPGGTGKTRLALQAAAEASDGFGDGVYWVALAPLPEPSLLPSALANALEFAGDGQGSPMDAICTHLRGLDALVLLDNAEHLLPAVADVVAELVRGTSRTRFLVTSRERLQLSSEAVYPVSELAAADAVALFVERARATGSDLSSSAEVAELCDRLERLPLALELAAARTVLFTPTQLLHRLGERLDLLRGTRDADPRQATLRATIDWSYELLSDEEQRVLRALSVFVGGCTFEAAQAVVGGDIDTLQSLLQKSMLRRRTGHVTERLWMLETVREYATERLAEADETIELRAAHVNWILGQAERASPHLIGPDQLQWIALFDDELGNIRAGIATALERFDAELAHSIVYEVGWFWTFRSLLPEACTYMEAILGLPGLSPESRCRALIFIAQASVDLERRESALTEAEQLIETITDPKLRGRTLEVRAMSTTLGNPDEQLEKLAHARALFEQTGEPDEIARITINLAAWQLTLGRLDDARTTGEEAVLLCRALGNRHKLGLALLNLAEALFLLGSPEAAVAPLREASALLDEIGEDAALSACLVLAGRFALAKTDIEAAARLLGAGDEIQRQTGSPPDLFDTAVREEMHETLHRQLGDQAVILMGEGAALERPAALALADHVLDRTHNEA